MRHKRTLERDEIIRNEYCKYSSKERHQLANRLGIAVRTLENIALALQLGSYPQRSPTQKLCHPGLPAALQAYPLHPDIRALAASVGLTRKQLIDAARRKNVYRDPLMISANARARAIKAAEARKRNRELTENPNPSAIVEMALKNRRPLELAWHGNVEQM